MSGDSPALRFLQAAADDFEADLVTVFEDRLEDCSPQLRTHLFELWARARRRPAAPSSRVLELAGLEARFRELLELELDEVMLASKLARVIVPGENVRLEKVGHMLELELKIPELPSGSPDDDFQEALRKRLKFEGLASDKEWHLEMDHVPVRMHVESGTLVGLDVAGRRTLHPVPVSTLLCHVGAQWCFPRPRPTSDYLNNEHVQLFVDSNPVAEVNDAMTWMQDGNEVEAVSLPGTAPTSSVRAVYTALRVTGF